MSRIIVKNIPKVFTQKQVHAHFSTIDEVTDVKIGKDEKGKSRGFAFVGFKSKATAKKAQHKFGNTYMGASKIRVDLARLKGEEENVQRDSTRERSRDMEKKKKNDEKVEVFQGYKKIIEQKSKKSWDDLIVPKHTVVDEFSHNDQRKNNSSIKKKQFSKPEPPKHKKEEQKEEVAEPKTIKAPRLSAKNKKFVTKPLEVDSNRLYITNIPYKISEEELKVQFRKYGNITKIKLPRQYDGKTKGYCFITFEKSQQALRAFSQNDNKIVFGRIIHIQPSLEDIGEVISTGKEKQYQEMIEEKYGHLEEKSSYKKKKKKEMRMKYNDTTSWNTLFLNPNTVLERMAKKLHITKSQILVSDNLAPKVALAQAQVIQQTKNWMTENNLNLNFLDKDRSLCERSKKILIVKNLNYKTQESELKQLLQFYGLVDKFMMAPNRAIAIVQFQSSQFADNALKNLQDHKFKNNYLFLEYAPVGMITEQSLKKREEDARKQEEEVEELSKIVYVKNLNFGTDQGQLYQIFEKIAPIKYARIVKKEGKSMGFGFVQFQNNQKAIEAVKKLNNCLVDGHKLILSLSRKKVQNMEDINRLKQKIKEEEEKSSKLMIRNIAFQAEKKDIKQLFQEYGSLRRVRIPKKMDGSHRGFAFVEYDTAEEAALAKQVLGSTHLYGRKLVIEYEKGSN